MLGRQHSRSSSLDSLQSDSYDELLRDLADVRLAVIKISNIPWDLTSGDIIELLACVRVEKRHIHIPIDRSTGKTKADMFVELPSLVESIKCIAKYNKRIIKGRAVLITPSSLDELIHAHFPDISPHRSGGGEFLSQAETISLVAICRNYKAHFSRKCAERPFEHVISILRLAPWHRMDQAMCERLYFVVFEAADSLVEHLSRLTATVKDGTCPSAPMPPNQLSSELLTRLVGSARTFPAFSDAQKLGMPSERPRFGSPMTLNVEVVKRAKHLRSTSIDRILAELGAERERTDAMNKFMRNAFDRIMLSGLDETTPK